MPTPRPRILRLACLDGDLDAIIPQEAAYAEARRTGATVDELTDGEVLARVAIAIENAGFSSSIIPADLGGAGDRRLRIHGAEDPEPTAKIETDGFVTFVDFPHGTWAAPRVIASVALAEGTDGIRDALVTGLETR